MNRRFEDAMNWLTHAENLLREGKFEQGWRQWEFAREHLAPYVPQSIPVGLFGVPELHYKDPIARGQKVIVLTEGGAGDQFLAIRYAQRLAAEGAEVMWQCPPEMTSVMRTAEGVHRVIDMSIPTHADWRWIRAMSLPARYGIWTPPKPYLKGPWWTRKRERVGLRFKSGPATPGGRDRDLPDSVIEMIKNSFHTQHWVDLDLPKGTSWNTTASRIAACRVVITVDTGVAHLAGALGVPTQLILGDPADWRWGPTGCPVNDFYPAMTQHWAINKNWRQAAINAMEAI